MPPGRPGRRLRDRPRERPVLPASGFIVQHLSPNAESILPQMLTKAGKVPVSHPEETNILLNRLGNHFADTGQNRLAEFYFKRADEAAKKAHAVHEAVYRYQMSPVETLVRRRKGIPEA